MKKKLLLKLKKTSGTMATVKNNKLETLDPIKTLLAIQFFTFLEDILEMKRLTIGQPNYFRKRINCFSRRS